MVNPELKKEDKFTMGGAAYLKTKFNAATVSFVKKDGNLNHIGMKLNCGEGIQGENMLTAYRN